MNLDQNYYVTGQYSALGQLISEMIQDSIENNSTVQADYTDDLAAALREECDGRQADDRVFWGTDCDDRGWQIALV